MRVRPRLRLPFPSIGGLAFVAGVYGGCDGAGGGACFVPCGNSDAGPFVACVVDFDPDPDTVEDGAFNHDQLPDVVQGPPAGSNDAVSLGCGGSIVLGFAEPGIVDGPGADFIVFENPFDASFPEPAQVEVSEDGCSWYRFDCDLDSLEGCAGVAVVHALAGSDIDPTDPEVAGGDHFDLAEVGLPSARFVRITDVSASYWDGAFCDPGQGGKGGADLDAIAIVHGSG